MTTTAQAVDQPTLTVTEEILVRASIETAFASLLAQLGPENANPEGLPLPMVLEAKPGGRWYRDLGGDNGHCWGFVQSINRPSLLELWGPLFMSAANTNNVLYRLSEVDGGTLISFKHTLVGPVPDGVRDRMTTGWKAVTARVQKQTEAAK